MRVIAGRYRGTRLRAPRGEATRPTSDRVREALFSILVSVEDARVLDLFAGSGALGIEALSRGATSAAFVDSAAAASAAVSRNLEALGLDAEVLRRPAAAFLEGAAIRGLNTISSSGPAIPTGERRWPGALDRAPADSCSRARGSSAESDRRAPLELDLPLARERRYGDTLIRIHVAR